MNPKVSVIVPVYNVEKELERCVRSLTEQSLREIEILLVDDGSPDRSGELCDRLMSTDARIQVIHKDNAGQGLARNAGLDIATGKYISFVDSDDFMEPDTYAKIYEKMEAESADLCCFGYVQQDTDGNISYRAVLNNHIYEKHVDMQQFMLHYFGDDPSDETLRGVSACMSVFRRDLIEEHHIRFQSERKIYSEDTIFSLDYCRYVTKVAVTEQCFYHYCLKSDSFTKGYQANKLELTLTLCGLLKDYAGQYGISAETEQRRAYVLWVSLMDCIKQECARRHSVTWTEIYRQVKRLCNEAQIRSMLNELPVKRMNPKQRMFRYFIYHRLILCVILLGYMRTRRGL